MKRSRRWILDLFLVISVMGLAGYYLVVNIDMQAAPAEDAAMLMRYAKHFSEGQGIVWNVGETPVDGATDFLFMVILGGLYRLGIGLEAGVHGLGIAAHFLTLIVVYFGALRMSGGRRWAAWLSAAFLAVGPGLRYSEAAFGTPFFALFVALTWLLAIRASEEPASGKWAFGFAFSSLVAGLIRPEGVLVGGFIMLAVMIRVGFKASRRILVAYLLVNLLLGGAYFLWRWNYFGYPLPNPFYRKGGWDFFGGSLEQAVRNTLNLSAPFWLAYIYGAAVWIWLGLLPLVRLFPALGKSLQKLAGDLTSIKQKTLSTALRIGLFVFLSVLIIALTRVSNPLHPVLVFGRYSPAYFALLLALLGTAILTWTADRWLLTRLAEDLARLGKHFQIEDLDQNRPALKAIAKQALFLALPAVGYVLMWGLLSDEMNYLARFQYALVPVILISWPGFFKNFWKAWTVNLNIDFKPAGRAFAGVVIVILSVFGLQRQYEQHLFTYQKDGRLDAALRLREFAGKGYSYRNHRGRSAAAVFRVAGGGCLGFER
ncbi:MAG: hypothetical protein AB9891_11695 [Anaerolineaceae bacterium]